MYCNIVFMIDIFVISKITQYRYYVIAITDVRSLGLSTKWRTLMIKKTMKVRENTFRKLEDPFENGAAKKYVFYVKVDDVAEGIPMATNPRDQKLTSGVATAIKESLLSNDGCFVYLDYFILSMLRRQLKIIELSVASTKSILR